MPRLASLVLWSSLVATALPAQVTPLPGTGCGSAITHVGGQPLRGQSIWITPPFPCLFSGPAVLAIGTAASIPVPGCSVCIL